MLNYYLSNTGDDTNIGTSTDKPFKTISKLNNVKLNYGDIVRFKKGDSWRELLNVKNGVNYLNYGTGKNPSFLGSFSKNNESDWVKESDGTWVTEINSDRDIGNIVINNNNCLVKRFDSNLISDNDFFWDKPSKILKVKTIENPAKVFSNIECCNGKDVISINNVSDTTFDGLAIKYGSAHGIGGYSLNEIKIKNCEFDYIGGAIYQGELRYGNAVELFGSVSNVLVEGCRINEIYDTGITNQSTHSDTKAITQSNITYKNNIITNCEWAYELWNKSETGFTNNINVVDNIMVNSGYGWSAKQRTSFGSHFQFFRNEAITNNVNINNNLCLNAKYAVINMPASFKYYNSVNLKDNKYKQTISTIAVWLTEKYYTESFDNYKQISLDNSVMFN